MTAGEIAVLVAAVLGSTGLASALNAGIQVSRAARLRSAITDSRALLRGLDSESGAFRAMQISISVMSLELAALTLVRIPHRVRGIVIVFVVVILGLFAILFVASWLFGNASIIPLQGTSESPGLFIYTGFVSLIYVATLLALLQLRLGQRREEFVASALRRNDVTYEMVTKRGFLSTGKADESLFPNLGNISHAANPIETSSERSGGRLSPLRRLLGKR